MLLYIPLLQRRGEGGMTVLALSVCTSVRNKISGIYRWQPFDFWYAALASGPLPMLTIFTPVNTYLWTLSLNMWNEFIIISFGISGDIISVRISPQFNAHSLHIVSISCQLNVSCSNEWKANSQPLIYPWILCNSILFKYLLNM